MVIEIHSCEQTHITGWPQHMALFSLVGSNPERLG